MDGGYADNRGLGYVDEGRRGHFIPEYARGNDAPVRMPQRDSLRKQAAWDTKSIGPTQPDQMAGRPKPLMRPIGH